MKLDEAIKTGWLMRRRGWVIWHQASRYGTIWEYPSDRGYNRTLIELVEAKREPKPYSREDLLADDWEIFVYDTHVTGLFTTMDALDEAIKSDPRQ